MSDLKRKLAEKIARDLFTSGERRYSHLSLNDAPELGWCEKAVADRIEEHLMDEYEEPVATSVTATWSPQYGLLIGATNPAPDRTYYQPPLCEKHNCQMALRDVQRETALECCKLRCLHCEQGEPVEKTRFGSWRHPEHFCNAAPIRERFGLKEKP